MKETNRTGEIQRKTSETEILLQLGLDGTGNHQIDIEIPFSLYTVFAILR